MSQAARSKSGGDGGGGGIRRLRRALLPTPREAAMIEFVAGTWGVRFRMVTAGLLFAVAALIIAFVPLPLVPIGMACALAGHVLLWVRSQTTSPGGGTPWHEEIWAPVEEEWMDRVRRLEERGARWDTSLFDVTNPAGATLFILLAFGVAVATVVTTGLGGPDIGMRVAAGAGILVAPLWINGVRTTWNPSELQKKGEALEQALAVVREEGADDFDPVPLLGLREGDRGKYPVDAKMMLRPATDDGSGVLGVQVQVAMNSVQGTDYPYLYAVVLVQEDARLPDPADDDGAAVAGTRRLVYESGQGDGARFLVVRQHADRSGGWHTEVAAIRRIVGRALELGRAALEANRS